MYEYQATVKKVVDGDTIIVDIDLGLSIIMRDVHVRFKGVSAPESRLNKKKPDEYLLGLRTKEFVSSVLPVGKKIIVKTFQDEKGKYGRLLATVFYSKFGDIINTTLVSENVSSCINLNEQLISLGLAKRYED